MSFVGKFLRVAVAQKLIRLAVREARKPQNQRRLRDAAAKVRDRRRRNDFRG